MVLVYEVVPGPECHQVSVVSGCRYADTTSAPDVSVAQLVCQGLDVIRGEVIVVPQHVIMRRSRSSWKGTKKIASTVNSSFKRLFTSIQPCAQICKIAEHTRTKIIEIWNFPNTILILLFEIQATKRINFFCLSLYCNTNWKKKQT